MSQALFSAISGMTTSQSKIDVVADNIANMNTVGFKASNLNFKNLYSRMLSSGSSPTSNAGGTNPMQVGLGVAIGSITRDFTAGTVQSTGRSQDLNIQGIGFFTIRNSNGSIGLTRDGNFTLDSEGYLVTANGNKIYGTNKALNNISSNEFVRVPPSLNMVASGKDLTSGSAGNLDSLNNASITQGKFTFNVYDGTSLLSTINIDTTSPIQAVSLKDIQDRINAAIAADPALSDGTDQTVSAKVNTDGTFSISIGAAGSLVTPTKIEFGDSTDTSNFLVETGISTSTLDTGAYTSKILSYQATIAPPNNSEATQSKTSYSVSDTGALEAVYSNGDKITVEDKNGSIVLKYITSSGMTIGSDDITVVNNAIKAENLQLQLATVMNEEGLISTGGNIFVTGPNTGSMTFSSGNTNGFGSIGSAGLESSNVNLSIEFANMIIAQRAIDANSRVFSASSEVLQRLVNM
ncbi:MAG: flagellar hook-basal body complex protein [Candidatus Gastranaerophilales bacterium]|nr:flagellar hook-basal body complex protein [Candidatus Gastranaerophilales bacterium]